MVVQIFLCQIDFGSFVMVAARKFVLAIFVPTATSLTMMIHTLGSSTTSTRLFGYFSLAYWFWYSFRWGLTTSMVRGEREGLDGCGHYFNGCAHA
jgi:hypothetical protein